MAFSSRDRGGHQEPACLLCRLGFRGPRLQRLVVGIRGQREARIGQGVIMTRIDPRLVRQGCEPLQRMPEFRVAAFEQTPAAEREQRVAAEQGAIRREPIRDVIGAMAGRIPHMRLQAADMHRVALVHEDVGAGNLVARLGGRHDPAAEAAFRPGIACT